MADHKIQKTSDSVVLGDLKEEQEMLTKVTCRSDRALSKKLGSFFNDSHFHDVVLKLSKGREYKAHRLVLCVWSEFFKEKLQGPSRSRAPSAMELFDLTEGESLAFEDVLRFMYTGEVSPKDDNVLDICGLAERFKVKELRRLCEEWIGCNIGDHNVVAASSRLREAEKLGLTHLTEKCHNIFCHYFTRLPETTWTSLPVKHVEDILKSSEVVVEDEKHVLQKLEAWINSNGGMERHKTVLVEKLLPQIRFRYMSAIQLKQVRESSIGELMKKHLPGVLEDAFEFRAVAGEQSKMLSREDSPIIEKESSSKYKLPRLYFEFDFAGLSQARPDSFKSYRISNYNTESRPVVVFNKDGHSWRDSRDWRFECKAFQESNNKLEPWKLQFQVQTTDRTQRGYHLAFLLQEAKPRAAQLADTPIGDRERLVLVAKGTLQKDEESDYTKKIILITPPMFEKSPKEIELKFVANMFMKGVSTS